MIIDVPGGLSALGIAGLSLGAGTAGYLLSPSDQEGSSTLSLSNAPQIEHNVSQDNIRDACREFSNIVGQEHVSTEANDLLAHSGSDYQSYAWTEETATPGAVVVYPASTAEVSEVVKICHRRRIPITPYSGGTSIEGNYVPHMGGICVSLSIDISTVFWRSLPSIMY